MRRRLSRPVLFGAVAALAAAGGIAAAAIPDSSGAIHGCYQKNNGNLRVVGSASDCRNSETAIQWNQKGQPGQPGSDGPPGPPGPAGGGIVARAHISAPVTLTNSVTPLPLVGNTWAREAGELNEITARVTLRAPSSCRPGGSAAPSAIRFLVNGADVGPTNVSAYLTPLGQTETREFGVQNLEPVFPADQPSESTVTVSVQDFCTSGEHVVVPSVDIIVVGTRSAPGVR